MINTSTIQPLEYCQDCKCYHAELSFTVFHPDGIFQICRNCNHIRIQRYVAQQKIKGWHIDTPFWLDSGWLDVAEKIKKFNSLKNK